MVILNDLNHFQAETHFNQELFEYVQTYRDEKDRLEKMSRQKVQQEAEVSTEYLLKFDLRSNNTIHLSWKT